MGEYEPDDSRNVTLTNNTAPGEPPRTGPREEKTRPGGATPATGEQGVRAAPQQGMSTQSGAGQSQSPGGQSQSMGGMSQSMGGMKESQQQPSASHRSDASSDQFGTGQQGSAAPAQGGSGAAEGTSGAAWAADFPASAAGGNAGGEGIAQPQTMQEPDADAERTRREQASGQDSQDAPQGLGYGAEEGQEMSDAPDASDRGYGGAGEKRMDKIERDR